MTEVGAVVVSWNSGDVIGACLDALLRLGLTEIVVVDNASSDATCQEVRRRPVRLIANPWNRGFAAAVNQGVELLPTPLILLLNPDTELLGGVEALIEACERPQAAAASGKLVDEAGRPQVGFMCRRFPTPAALAFEMLGINRLWPRNPVNQRYRCLDLNPDRPAAVDQPAGAFLMFRRDVWRELGGFSECYYPLWYEDVDYLRRAALAGYRVYYEPEAVARHLGAASVSKLAWEERQWYWYDNLFRFAARHFRPFEYRAVLAAAIVASLLRGAGGILVKAGVGPRAYARIMRLAIKRLLAGGRESKG
jgi:GT2 family glycosyltransferase